jgi:phage replication O-like protein O
MASPQLENGYFSIATEFWDALARYRLPGEQMQVLMVVIRKTWGFHKKEDGIPLSQFQQATGINKPNISRALNELLSKKIIVKNGFIKIDNKHIQVLGINKDFQKWVPLSKKITTFIKKDKKALSKKITSKYNRSKDNPKDIHANFSSPDDAVEEYFSYTSKKGRVLRCKKLRSFDMFWEAFNYKRGRADAADAWLDIKDLKPSILDRIIERARQEAEARPELVAQGHTPKMAQGWLTARRWEDEAGPVEPKIYDMPGTQKFDAEKARLDREEKKRAVDDARKAAEIAAERASPEFTPISKAIQEFKRRHVLT